MAGYSGYSKSNNAVHAERNGRFPASVLAKKLGVKSAAIVALIPTSEWHHVSKFFNTINYYDLEQAVERLEELKAWEEPKENEISYNNCSGSYLEWSGTRNYPKAKKINFESIKVTKKGKWFILNLPTGIIRKNESTRGFHLIDKINNKKLTFNQD